ncbi:serine/threonine-protein kinase nekl-2-like [Cheilinus undulatus]|uniref:serine/threonine-protein kinase nekl-2-like n=1 Tax=Cheilinus undulatus TaxID=241271 RepID=UPI001BD67E68|nr:serine/threonine-protein kinase nekl-2-like [Cheilinus undulatus]
MERVKSMLSKNGYTAEKETELGLIATKNSERFLVANFMISKNEEVIQEAEILKEMCHPHIMDIQESLKDEDLNLYSVVLQYCEGGSLTDKIKEKKLEEWEALSWIVEVCMALRAIHEKLLIHGDLTPQNIFITEFGKLYLGGFWKNKGSLKNTAAGTARNEAVNYQAPEVFLNTIYNTKSEIWSLGCILYELCTQQQAFSAENTVSLISKITSGSAPSLDDTYSAEFCDLLSDMLNEDPDCRPTANEILGWPITLTCLLRKSKTTVDYLQDQLDKLKEVANGLERVHTCTTIGSLTGGVIGAAGGITSIVGLALAPFTLGASLVVTGIGVGVGVAGGVTAGVSNITKMVAQSADRKTVWGILKEFSEKINAVAFWLQEINHNLENMTKSLPAQKLSDDNSSSNNIKTNASAARIGKVLGGAAAVARYASVAKIGKMAAQVSRAVSVAKVATGVLSGLFVAVDIFFIAMDAKEISNIRQAQADGETSSEIMKFILSIRNSAKELQEVLDELKVTIKLINTEEAEKELEWEYATSE